MVAGAVGGTGVVIIAVIEASVGVSTDLGTGGDIGAALSAALGATSGTELEAVGAVLGNGEGLGADLSAREGVSADLGASVGTDLGTDRDVGADLTLSSELVWTSTLLLGPLWLQSGSEVASTSEPPEASSWNKGSHTGFLHPGPAETSSFVSREASPTLRVPKNSATPALILCPQKIWD